MKQALVPLAAVALVAAWWWTRAPTVASGSAPVPSAPPAMPGPDASQPDAPGRGPRGMEKLEIPGTPSGPPSPAELEALRRAEVANSQAHPPVATYRGADGRQHVFRYEATPAEQASQLRRERRERELMAELEADPGAFARKHKLQAREIERILDGSLPLPPALLED